MSMAVELREAMGTGLLPRFPFCPQAKREELLRRIDSHQERKRIEEGMRRAAELGAELLRRFEERAERRRFLDKMRGIPEIDFILSLPYGIYVVEEEDAVFAKVVEWEGCMTEVDDLDDVDEAIQEAMIVWALDVWEDGEEVPMPMD